MRKTKFTPPKRVLNALENTLDTLIKDIEIRAYWNGLRDGGSCYSDAIELTQIKFIVSKSQVKKALYAKD